MDRGALDLDQRVRLVAFRFLTEQTQLHGDVLPRTLLATGFTFAGTRVPLIGHQGIFKPAILPEMPLSITTVPVVEGQPRPYEDGVGPAGLLLYRYRGTDPNHRDNVGLRLAMQRRVPLVYLFGVVPGQYLPVWPVYIVVDDPTRLCFSVSVDDAQHANVGVAIADPTVEARGSILRLSPSAASTKRASANGFSRLTRPSAPCVVSGMSNCWKRPISFLTDTSKANRLCRMGSLCVSSTTQPSTGITWVYGPI